MADEQHDILLAAGLNPGSFEQVAYAPSLDDEHPAILAGTYANGAGRSNTAIRAWPVVVDGQGRPSRWDAIAFVSAHPALALDQLSVQERERLRAQSQTPSGADAPVGQEKVLAQPPPTPAPPPYAPPLQPLEAQAAEEPLPDDEGIQAIELNCHPGCMEFRGPQGTQPVHVEGCEHFVGGPEVS